MREKRGKSQSFRNIFLAFSGGILMGLTVAPFSLWYLAWIALIPIWIIGRKSTSLPIVSAFAWGCGYHGLALFWITGIHPMTWMGVPWLSSLSIAIGCWLFITCWGAVLVSIWAISWRWLGQFTLKYRQNPLSSFLIVLIGVSCWCIFEKIWSYSPLWWTSLSYTQSPHNLPILQFLQVSGPTTITASILLVNGLLAEGIIALYDSAIKKNIKQPTFNSYLFVVGLVILISLHWGGRGIYHQRAELSASQNSLRIGIIQGNIPNEIKLYPQGWREAIEGYTRGYQILARQNIDIILTPETALPFDYNDIRNYSSFYQALSDKKVPAWLGAFGKVNGKFTNSLFTITGAGTIASRYDKVHLVPLGEYVPFNRILGNFIRRLSPLDTHLMAGAKNQIFDTPFGRAIVGICYDSAYSDHFRRQAAAGGKYIITASNNAHYSSTMPAQHHAQDVMRAIETDRWLARATNTGYSAIIDHKGNTKWISQLDRYQLHGDTIYLRQTQTLYVKSGDWLVKVFASFLVIYCLFCLKQLWRSAQP